jgi:xanthine dehydrogenase YagT iron-sulfur-binding subunit
MDACVDVGTVAPDLSVETEGGRRVTLREFRGRPVVLAFVPRQWDPWRTHQLTHFQQLAGELPGAGELVAVSVAGAGGGPWCEVTFPGSSLSIPLFSGLDPESAIAARYGVRGEWAMFLVDAAGTVVWRQTGSGSPAPQLEDLVNALTSSRSVPRAGGPPTRREFLTAAVAAACALALRPFVAGAQSITRAAVSPGHITRRSAAVTLTINGRPVSLDLEPRVTLLDALREYAGLTGTKKGCDHGQCGACTVHINGRRQLSCLTFAVMHQHDAITTVEGLSDGATLHPMQAAFVAHDGFQCGYCTPGQIMSATALLHEPCGPSDADVKECMSGNLCRCGAYPGIVAAIQSVRASTPASAPG